jgi:hypothetical protein
MDLETITTVLGIVTGVVSGSYAAIRAGMAWHQQSVERRMKELVRLLALRKEHQDILDEIFDYSSLLDDHLRVAAERLVFTHEEFETRARADRAFEHFRELHLSVQMGLIEKVDLSPWTYWIHRVFTRDALKRYSEACGYDAFMSDLARWTENAEELRLLKTHCPWWKMTGRDATQLAAAANDPNK